MAESNGFKCPACHCVYSDPQKILSGHTLCGKCIDQLKEDAQKITCSEDHTEHTILQDDLPHGDPELVKDGVKQENGEPSTAQQIQNGQNDNKLVNDLDDLKKSLYEMVDNRISELRAQAEALLKPEKSWNDSLQAQVNQAQVWHDTANERLGEEYDPNRATVDVLNEIRSRCSIESDHLQKTLSRKPPETNLELVYDEASFESALNTMGDISATDSMLELPKVQELIQAIQATSVGTSDTAVGGLEEEKDGDGGHHQAGNGAGGGHHQATGGGDG